VSAGRGRIGRAALAVVVALVGGVSLVHRAGPAEAAPPAPTYFASTPLASWRAEGVGWASLVVGDTLYVGGTFATVRSPDGATTVARANLAAFDLRTGALRAGFRADTNGDVRALASDGTHLFVGGAFSTVNGTSRLRLAAVDLATGAVASWRADANSNVYALSMGGDRLFAAGSFTTLAGVARSRVGALDPASAAVVPWAPTLDNTVVAVAANADGTAIFLGGDFHAVNGTGLRWLARVDGAGALVPVAWQGLTVRISVGSAFVLGCRRHQRS
jgi:hypothetical protein